MKLLLVVAGISILFSSVQSLQCQNGTIQEVFGAEISNSFQLITCLTNDSYRCARFEVQASGMGFPTTTIIAGCILTSRCISGLPCAAVEQTFVASGQTVSNCDSGCCDVDNCNNERVASFQPTTSPVPSAMAPTTSSAMAPTEGGRESTTSGEPRLFDAGSLFLVLSAMSLTALSFTSVLA